LDSLGVAVAQLGPDGLLIETNPAWLHVTGVAAERQRGHGWRDMWHTSDRTRLAEAAVTAISVQQLTTTRARLAGAGSDADERWFDLRFAPHAGGAVVMANEVSGDVRQLRHLERLQTIVEKTPDLVSIIAPNGQSVYANAAARRLAGLTPLDASGAINATRFRDRLTSESRTVFDNEAVPAVINGGTWVGEVSALFDIGEVPLSIVLLGQHNGTELEYVAAIGRDISDRKMLESRLAHQATHDALTGLPNRVLLLDRLEQALARAHRSRSIVAVLFCDMDNFKVINDSLGHATGDAVLIEAARRIAEVLRPSDTVARFGGDEFVVLCDQINDPADALIIAHRINESLSQPIDVLGHDVVLSMSVGVAVARADVSESAVDLVRDADAAMYRAKELGRSRVEVFDLGVRERVITRLELERDLRRALERDQLAVHYQPIISTESGALLGFEALVRWNHPERGLLGPDMFIGLAEETGLIVPIGAWVIGEACRQLQAWRSVYALANELDLAINLSGRQLAHPDLVALVDDVLVDSGIEPHRLVLEITESVLLKESDGGIGVLHRLSRLGVRIGIDDFGTGYSSLAYLQSFPADVVKIDRSFVQSLTTSNEAIEIVRLVVTLADALGLTCVAEGVERPEQLAQLRRLGVERVQGYLFNKPLSPLDAEHLLRPTPTPATTTPTVIDLRPAG
jgi:diguanylate cyclase (GGDEF)-like protein/PAS domain S-box-containing protein